MRKKEREISYIVKSLKPLVFILTVIIIDQFTKYLARGYLPIHFNQGVSFGLLNHYPLLTLSTSVLIIIILTMVLLFKKPKLINLMALSLLLSGGISNTIDRVGNNGAVIDWIKIWFFPVFNLGDLAITSGVILLVYGYFTS